MFGAVYAVDGSAIDVLVEVAREFSPRIEIDGPRALARQVVLDLSGVTRLFGDPRAMGEALRRTAADRGLRVRVAIAGTRTAARLLVCAASGPVTVVDPGTEATALAPLPIQRLAVLTHDEPAAPPAVAVLSTVRRWGLRTLGEVAVLPAAAVAARLGQEGVRWQRLARGEDPRPLLPVAPEGRFEQALELGARCSNVMVDTSSSNSWMADLGLDLAGVFHRTLAMLGPDRILFGTDSCTFPRGWRSDVRDAQWEALNEAGADADGTRAVMGGNLDRLLPA